jgi:MFS family permease
MTRHRAFWVALALVSVLSAGFATRNFSRAFPLVSLDIRMDRDRALSRAEAIATERHLGPSGARQAASFALDAEAQTFVELEGGGKEVFASLVADGRYAPYTWRVRRFKEGEKHEVILRFTPEGRPYGFVERLSEDQPGAALAPEAARAVAERVARTDWGVDLASFALVSQSEERRPSGRVDHTFVYERTGARLNEGRFRLRLVVSGDRLTELTHFIQIPEAFSRRYEAMRSANQAIGVASTVAMAVLYVLGGIGVGLFVLVRQRWVVWRPAVLWGIAVGGLQLLAGLNQWPLVWMSYDTALPRGTFVAQTLAGFVAEALALTALCALSFMAAESLTRRAFPSHPQLWRLASREAAASRAVLGRTAAAYLLVAVFFAYEVALYLFATRLLGWWTPSEALFSPDVLATYQPWLSAVAPSVQAGFWEEALFRAVPLAGAALLGDRLGHRWLWVGVAMVVQAAVFGAGHAPYPTQPAYARAVELVIPSLAFGALYLRFGLLPAIVMHYVYDLVWFSLPIFVSSGTTARVSQALVVLCAFAPVWVILAARVRMGRWVELPATLLNGAWTPPPAEVAPAAETTAAGREISPRVARGLVVAGLAGLAVWAIGRPWRSEIPPLRLDRAAAAAAAREALSAREVSPGPEWWVLPVVATERPGGRFVWETARDRYFELLGSYLDRPHWRVRVARFEGDVAERAEEWVVHVGGDGRVERVEHRLPEARAGASLTEPEARARALEVVREQFGVDARALKHVSSVATKRPARMDWEVTFADTSVPPLPQGELRVAVALSGDETSDARRFVYVPEEWERAARARQTRAAIVSLATSLLLAGLGVGGAALAVVGWARKRFSVRLFAVTGVVVLASTAAAAVNSLPSLVATFSTAQPWRLQLLTYVAVGVVALVLMAAAVALVAGAVPRWGACAAGLDHARAWRIGPALGALALGVQAAAGLLRSTAGPPSPSFEAASGYLPALGVAVAPVPGVILRTVFVFVLLTLAHRVTRAWTTRRVLGALVLVVLGGLAGAESPGDGLVAWAVSGLASGVLLWAAAALVLRSDMTLVPLAVGTMAVLSAAREGAFRAFPGAAAGAALAVVLTTLVTWWWWAECRRATRPRGDVAEGGGAA